ncbi:MULTISPECIES: GatB/YqeY domain-containing protein [Allobacillus]|uniref:GatB/YqeY domain-containing protein n=1 Tax=Allobacillus halotolerans TaxID=570278 RepID=A0ABS6GL44_9BACI|nr:MULTISPECIES: GatB/YqeY domain-containing protein [Allobacillus]MBU6079705.1 GatB/YqeY domain-containing protein [Allobacillus halotolerans]TSJ68233.1 GatB/YqeY domain-containing protein [Allobacillus sp. SKP2-8]
MSMLEQLNADMKTAMKNREKEKLTVIRMVKSSLQNEAIKKQADLTEEEELQVLSREVKQRNDSLHEFRKANREDLAEQVENELAIIQAYMPEQLSDEELEKIIQETIDEQQATSKKDMGKVMSAVMPKVKGKADGSKVNQFVMKHLQ